MEFTVCSLYFCICSLFPWKDTDSSEQLYSGKAVVLSRNGIIGKAFKKGKTSDLFYLKGSEYIPLYQW